MEAGGGGSAVKQGGGSEEGEQHATTIRWKPDEQCLEMLLAMGIDRNAALKGLYYTGNYSAEFAASYVFDNPDLDEELETCMRITSDPAGRQESATRSSHARDAQEETGEMPQYKMAFVLNSSLGMGVGKTAVEVGHASVRFFRRLSGDEKRFGDQLLMWEIEGEKKVVLRGEDVSHLEHLEKQALSLGLETYFCVSSERSEPQSTVTVLALFGREDAVNSVTDKLPQL